MKENITVESIEKLGKRNARTSMTLTRPQIEQNFRLFGSIIPASSTEYDRRRTAYFYRKEAIAWAREARRPHWMQIASPGVALRLAKSYLAIYRQMKGAN
jgi:hypothetical protein